MTAATATASKNSRGVPHTVWTRKGFQLGLIEDGQYVLRYGAHVGRRFVLQGTQDECQSRINIESDEIEMSIALGAQW